MAQWNKNTQDYKSPHNNTLHEVFMRADQYGNILNEGATHRSAFGEPVAIPITPVIQLDGLYGLNPNKFETYTGAFTGDPGTATTTNTLMRVTTDTGIGSYGVIRSRRAVRYRPGQGALCRFTAKFSTGTAGYTQRAGFFAQEQALQIGYDGTSFGILIENGGKAHIHAFTITTLDAGDVTVTLNNEAYTAVTVAGTTLGDRIASLAAGLEANSDFTADWIVEYDNTKICFLSTSLGVKSGTYSMTSTATISTTNSAIQSGVATNAVWTPQTSFNIDTLDGNGPSGVILDPQKLNVYQINFRWLGAGELRFAVENPINGDMIFFHHEHYSNRNTDVHIDNPSLKLGYVAASLGGSGSTITVEGASMMGAIEGLISPTDLPDAVSHTRTAGMSGGTNEYAILALRNNVIHKGKINTREMILKRLAIGGTAAGGAPLIMTVWYNPATAVALDWVAMGTESSASYSFTETTVTTAGLIPLFTSVISDNTSDNIDLNDLRIVIPPNNEIVVTAKSTANINRANIGLTWIED
jgi:hypothetical protein